MTDQERNDARLRANEARTARAQLKRDLQAGTVTLRDLLGDPPELIAKASLLDVLTWVRRAPRHSGGAGLEQLGRDAVNARPPVNLLLPVGRASQATRQWAAEHGTRGLPGRSGT